MAKQRSRSAQRRPGVQIGSGRETELERRVNKYEQRSSILVATNGERTEVTYLKALSAEPWVRNARMTVIFENGSPAHVVTGAAERRSRDDYDQAWAVCDVDEYDTVIASTEAERLAVSLLWSNPCFEVWLILHKAPCSAHIEDGRRAEKRLCQEVPDWDKTKLNFDVFRPGIGDAVRRAKDLGDPPHANPSTALWRLIEALGWTDRNPPD
jgi:hypothetical protein